MNMSNIVIENDFLVSMYISKLLCTVLPDAARIPIVDFNMFAIDKGDTVFFTGWTPRYKILNEVAQRAQTTVVFEDSAQRIESNCLDLDAACAIQLGHARPKVCAALQAWDYLKASRFDVRRQTKELDVFQKYFEDPDGEGEDLLDLTAGLVLSPDFPIKSGEILKRGRKGLSPVFWDICHKYMYSGGPRGEFEMVVNVPSEYLFPVGGVLARTPPGCLTYYDTPRYRRAFYAGKNYMNVAYPFEDVLDVGGGVLFSIPRSHPLAMI
jgi:hypothetical protein